MGNSVILSFIKAILSPFFCYELSQNVFKSAKSCGYTNFSSPGWITTAYILFLFLPDLLFLFLSNILTLGIILLLSIISILIKYFALTYIQKAINFYNKKLGFEIKKDYSVGEIVIIVSGIVLLLFYLSIFISILYN